MWGRERAAHTNSRPNAPRSSAFQTSPTHSRDSGPAPSRRTSRCSSARRTRQPRRSHVVRFVVLGAWAQDYVSSVGMEPSVAWFRNRAGFGPCSSFPCPSDGGWTEGADKQVLRPAPPRVGRGQLCFGSVLHATVQTASPKEEVLIDK
ncbi:hypothetical protein AAFF_G00264400 [Aldrovandia affinis]|uniref:Uncharacterized protein n=1 Tax=Aldrovandia affinis TaxID=143900 RepID=A0AAD7SSU2_9TELE|nr:hypothetical protein AAFF_G00264400 [Aldrovandia affinis]